MITNKLTRTTITIPENLLFEIKMEALNKRKTMNQIILEKLTQYMKQKPLIKSESF